MFPLATLPSDSAVPMSKVQEAYTRAWLFLRLAGLLERLEDLSAVGTHPPAAKRLAYLRAAGQRTAEAFGVQFEQLEVIAVGFDSAFERLMEHCPPLPGLSPLEELLERIHTAELGISSLMVTGRARREVLNLLGCGAPGKLCRELGRSLGRAEHELRALGIDVRHSRSEDRPSTATDLEAFRKPLERFMLIAGINEAYLVPEITRFIDRPHEEYLREMSHAAG